MRTILENNKTGFVFKIKDVNDLVNKIQELFVNPEQYKEFSNNARNRILKNFSDEVVSKKLINIYENLFNQ